MIFKGYLIICAFKEDNYLYYLLNNFEKGKRFCDVGLLEAADIEKKLHLMEEKDLDQYIEKNIKDKSFSIKMIVPICILNNKPFLKNPRVF